VQVSRTLPVHPDIVVAAVIFKRDVQRLMNIADPMPQGLRHRNPVAEMTAAGDCSGENASIDQ
jgi:hypothetical protein